MGIIDISAIKCMKESSEMRNYGKNVVEKLVATLVDHDKKAFISLINDVWNGPLFIRDEIFWQNFIQYINDTCTNQEELRKFSNRLAESDNPFEDVRRIIGIIDAAQTQKKVKYISNLTRACCMGNITKSKFFKLAQCIERLTDEDIDLLNNVSEAVVKTDEEFIEDFRNCGLLKEIDGGFAYTKRAYELKKYSLQYELENTVKIPQIPNRQMPKAIEEITEDEIDKICK